MKYKYVTELLAAVNDIEDPLQRAILLNENMREPVAKILAMIHNPDIDFINPKDLVYDTGGNKLGIADTTLEVESKRLYIFQKSYPIDPERKKIRLLQLLESLAGEESDFLFYQILPKKNPYKNIQKPFIKKYFPFLLTKAIDR